MLRHCGETDTLANDVPRAEADRVRLAAHSETPVATLRLLADDPAVMVRAAVAMNPTFAPSLHTRMLDDADERVRTLLAGKVSRLLPELSGEDRREAQAHAHGVLLSLAKDAAVRVRLTLSEMLRAMPEAPRAVIMQLAQDPAVTVSEPVLRLSPLLTDQDLLELLAAPPHPGAARAVAMRVGLSGEVAHAIATTADGAAVHALLLNGSATVREGTLDALIGRAGDHPEWHEPLVQRPALPERAARALALIVAGHVSELLLRRVDLPPSLAAEIRSRLAGNLAVADDAALMEEVCRQHGRRPLTEADLTEAAENGNARRVLVILAVASGTSLERLDRTVGHRNAKGLVSLVWRCGFSMAAAHLVQSALGAFAPGEMIVPGAQGSFPLSTTEMEWQIELLAEPGS